MNLLKSHHNDFPEYYAEYSLNDLGNNVDYQMVAYQFGERRAWQLESLEIDIKENGLTHPIIIWASKRECRTSPNPKLPKELNERRNILYVQIGHQRVWVAKKLGYTHISAYHVVDQDSYDTVVKHTTSEEYWEKRI